MLQALCQGGRRGFGPILVLWMPGLIILRHPSALRVLRRDQVRLHHDVTPAPIRVLADFILTQPASQTRHPSPKLGNLARLGTTV